MSNPQTSTLHRPSSSSSFYGSSIFDELSPSQLALLDPPTNQYPGGSNFSAFSPDSLNKLSREARFPPTPLPATPLLATPSPCIEFDVFGQPVSSPCTLQTHRG
ncbi:hypothetical protein K440DRAFT_614496 [Wilcoxina mikolae CBS 423.85]|nr:hypothetical protein K440DRAFT_614496 [Wilcoxina mikolae CBS 423.85]